MRSRLSGEVLLEFHQVGNAVKVTAVDPTSLVEVSIVGSPSAGEEMLKRAAIRKLEFVLERGKGRAGNRQRR